jgi:ribonuclease E
MTKIMLIDATHPEETRVAVVDGRRLEEFDVEVASRHPLKGNIYLAKVTRVEPSLQAAFVEYGGNRHGFLAFSEIHPDYYRIPVADREALMREDREEEAEEQTQRRHRGDRGRRRNRAEAAPAGESVDEIEHDDHEIGTDQEHDLEANRPMEDAATEEPAFAQGGDVPADAPATEETPAQVMPLAAPYDTLRSEPVTDQPADAVAGDSALQSESGPEHPTESQAETQALAHAELIDFPGAAHAAYEMIGDTIDAELPAPAHGDIVEVTQPPEVIDTVGGEEASEADDTEEEDEDDSDRRRRQRHLRRYKIQEVIKRRQILLVQVTKEERGNKGAALTTYLSLAGRYCVLMPNTDRGGGISRRITSVADRKRLKSIVDELDPPEGMAVIVRTAGMERQRSEIKRDFEYLLRLWDEIRENTLRSSAPALIYEEASLIKRSIRDLYTRDIGDIVVAGAESYKSARSFMRMLAPGHAKRVQLYRDPSLPLFQRYQIESQIAAIHHPVVNLRSGGYIVINQTEALVAVDVNSGRSTRERNIEETALRTNLEAAEEVARQLRLRDLAGLIVIDFIDMDESRNNAAVERRLKDALRNDRARIQIGRISSFGLLEMSRQRLHASLQEASTEICPHCHGTGRMRSVDSTALHVLRMVEEEITRNATPGVTVFVPSAVALYILNQKRHALAQLELRRGVRIYLSADDELTPPDYRLERIKVLAPGEELPPAPEPQPIEIDFDESEDENYVEELDEAETAAEGETEAESAGEEAAAGEESTERQGRGRRRRRRRGRGGRFQADEFTEQAEATPGEGEAEGEGQPRRFAEGDESLAQEVDEGEDSEEALDGEDIGEAESAGTGEDEHRRRRRRGRRGGRRRSRRAQEGVQDGTLEGGAATGVEDREYADTLTGAIPGLGEQPEFPTDLTAGTESLPPAWRGGTKPAIASDGAEAVESEETAKAERPRRARRPRRDRDAAPEAAVETTEGTVGTAPSTLAPVSAMAEPDFAGASLAERSVTVIEVKDSGEAVAATVEDDPNQPKKRGWWRRLME